MYENSFIIVIAKTDASVLIFMIYINFPFESLTKIFVCEKINILLFLSTVLSNIFIAQVTVKEITSVSKYPWKQWKIALNIWYWFGWQKSLATDKWCTQFVYT